MSQLGPGMAWADVDGDKRDDLYLGTPSGQTSRIYSFARNQILMPPAFKSHKDCEDMAPLFFDADGDGDMDLYVVSGSYEFDRGDRRLQDRLYLNNGKGQFKLAPQGTIPDIRESGSVVTAADFDRDGDLDLFVGGRMVPGAYPTSPRSFLLRNEKGQIYGCHRRSCPGIEGKWHGYKCPLVRREWRWLA